MHSMRRSLIIVVDGTHKLFDYPAALQLWPQHGSLLLYNQANRIRPRPWMELWSLRLGFSVCNCSSGAAAETRRPPDIGSGLGLG